MYNNLINTIYKMEAIFTNTENSKTNEPHRFRLALTDKLNFKDPNENMALANISIARGKILNLHINNNKFKISAPTWNDEFDLSDGSCSISDIQDCFEYIIKKHKTIAKNLPVQIINKHLRYYFIFCTK